MGEPENKQEEPMTLEDVYKLFYVLVAQNQQQHPGTQMSFDLKIFNNLPKNLKLNFEKKSGRLFVWIKRKKEKKKSSLYLPTHKIVTPN